MTNSINKKKFSNAWLIVVACMLIQAIPFGVASNIHPQYLKPIMDTEGFGLGAISLMFTFGTIISALFSPTIGKLFNKFPAKIIFTVGAIVSASGIFMLSIAGKQIVLFYLGYGIAQVGAATMSSIGIPVIMMSWFDDSLRGKATGLAFAGSGLGNIFLQQFSVNWIAQYGYAAAYQRFALLSLVVGLAVSLLFIRTAKDNSEVAVGKNKEVNTNTEEKVESKEGYTLAEATKMKAYWIFAIAFAFIGIYVSALATQYSAFLGSKGFDKAVLGTVGSIFAACSLFGNLLGGTFYDKFGTTKTTVIGFVLALVACLSLMLAPQIPALAYVYGVSKGVSVFAYILAPSMLVGALFGRKDFGAILGITQVFFALGFAFGSFVFGVIVDKAGYMIAWSFILVAILVAYSMLLVAIKAMSKAKKENLANFDSNEMKKAN